MKFKPEDYPEHEWQCKQNGMGYKQYAYICKNCSTRILDLPAEQYGIFVFDYMGKNKTIFYSNSLSNRTEINKILNKFKKISCNEIIIKDLLE